MRLTPLDELSARLTRLQQGLQARNLDGAIISQNADLFYFTGTMQTSNLFVPASGDVLLLTRRSHERACQESPLPHILPIRSLKEIPGLLGVHGYPDPARLGLELDVLPANTYLAYRELLPETRLVDVSPLIRSLRAVKSEYEVAILREAAQRMDNIFAAVESFAAPGVTEVELAGLLESIARRDGHPGIIRMRYFNQEIFYGHVLSGESGTIPSYLDSPTGGFGLGPAMPQGASLRAIRPGEPLLVDLVAVVDGMMVDQTRMFALGDLPQDLLSAHQAMLEVQSAVTAAAVPGAVCGDLYELAVAAADEWGLADNFMGMGADRIAFVGHGVGLELNELPVLARGAKAMLQAGNVFALEPKCLFPGRGAVGIENTWLVTESGSVRLTFTPDELTIL
jgi:Xaa-Pro dipeptidase